MPPIDPHSFNFFILLVLGGAIAYGLMPVAGGMLLVLAGLWLLAQAPLLAIVLLVLWCLRWLVRDFFIGLVGGLGARASGVFNSPERAEREREAWYAKGMVLMKITFTILALAASIGAANAQQSMCDVGLKIVQRAVMQDKRNVQHGRKRNRLGKFKAAIKPGWVKLTSTSRTNRETIMCKCPMRFGRNLLG